MSIHSYFKNRKQEWNLNRKIYLVLIFIMVMSMITQMYFGVKKEGYHLDEMYNYGFSNSEYLPILHFGSHDYMVKDWMKDYGAGDSIVDLLKNIGKDFVILKENGFRLKETPIYRDYLRAKANSNDMTTTTWVPGQDYRDYLSATRESRFNLASSYYNPRGDNHPPLYYMMSHIVCSFFPGVFSKWFGLGLNMFLMVLTLGVLFRFTRRFTGDPVPALLITASYGLTSGAISTVLLIRMYVLLTLAFLLMAEVHLQIFDDDFAVKKKHGKKLIAVTVFGYLAQYAFIMYAIPLVIVMTILMVTHKKRKELLSYYICLFISAVIGVCLWPFGIKHIFGSRGAGTMQNLARAFDFSRVKIMFGHMTSFLFNGIGLLWIFALVIMFMHLAMIRQHKKMRQKVCLLYLPVVLYFLVTADTVRLLADRYLMCIYPFVYIYFISSVYAIMKTLGDCPVRPSVSDKITLSKTSRDESASKSRGNTEKSTSEGAIGGVFDETEQRRQKKGTNRCRFLKPEYLGLIILTLVLLAVGNGFVNEPGYLFTGGQETIHLPENTDSIFVLPDEDWNESIEYASVLAQSNRVGVCYISNLEVLRDGFETEQGEYLCVFMKDYMDTDETIKKVKEALCTTTLEEVERAQSYYVKRVLFRTNE